MSFTVVQLVDCCTFFEQHDESNAAGTCVCVSLNGAPQHIEVPRVLLFIKFHLWYVIVFVATGETAYNFYLMPIPHLIIGAFA